MLELEQAQEQILSVLNPLASETVSVRDALGRFAAQNATSPMALPPFDNSAMDGYAVQAQDVADATANSPKALRVVGKVAAGEISSTSMGRGECVRLFTGSPLPKGADAVVMQEDTKTDSADAQKIWITDGVKPWENVRFRGEDIKEGFTFLQSGERVTLGKLSLLGAVGISEINVGRRPVVGLLATGSELIEPGETLAPGKIYESNRIGLAALAAKSGAIPQIYPLVKDDLHLTQAALEKAFSECDVVVTSGGVSVGEFDFVKAAFARMNGELSFWKVAIRPGKPFVFGQAREKFLFGVPGNPVSALVTFFLLVQPALLRLQGATICLPRVHFGTLKESLQNSGDRRHFVRVTLDEKGNARGSGIQASHILSSLANAHGLVDVPPRTTLSEGTTVKVLPWE